MDHLQPLGLPWARGAQGPEVTLFQVRWVRGAQDPEGILKHTPFLFPACLYCLSLPAPHPRPHGGSGRDHRSVLAITVNLSIGSGRGCGSVAVGRKSVIACVRVCACDSSPTPATMTMLICFDQLLLGRLRALSAFAELCVTAVFHQTAPALRHVLLVL